MDLDGFTSALKAADDATRFSVAKELADRASPKELVGVAGLLVKEDQTLRLGAICVLALARFKPAAGALVAVAKSRRGEERAAALHALAEMCGPDDKDKVLPALEAAKDDPDQEVQQARERAMELLAPREKIAEEAGAPMAAFGLLSPDRATRRTALVRAIKEHDAPARLLAESLLETRSDGVRMDLIGGLGTMPAEAIRDAVLRVANDADDDLLALLARMLERKLLAAEADVRHDVARALGKAKRRADSPLAKEALATCALKLAPELAVVEQAGDVATLEEEATQTLLDSLAALEGEGRAAALKALISGLAKAPGRVAVFAESLYADVDALDVVARSSLAALCVRAASGSGDDEELSRHLGPLARLFARVVLPGAPLPRQLVTGLLLSPSDQDRYALIELCAALQTEEGAAELARLARGEQPEGVRERALQALRELTSSEVEVLLHPDDTVELLPRWTTPTGERLLAEGRDLVDRAGQRWLLGADGVVVREADTPHGGCRCCHRPRVLEAPARTDDDDVGPPARPSCPVTGKTHLQGDDGPVLEDGHPLGGCVVCESLRPLEREGKRVGCPSCHTAYERKDDAWVPKKSNPGPTIELYALDPDAPPPRSDVIPQIDDEKIVPPTDADLDDLPEEVVRAMRANVVLYGRGGFRAWGGTGILIARADDEVAILTARQNIEETLGEQAGQRVPVQCVTIAGEDVPARVVWVARSGVDLALLAAKLDMPDTVDTIPLELARPAKLGDELYAVGNQLGFPWSFTRGPVSGLRTLSSSSGQQLRFVQTPMPLATGTGGGGLYHASGELAGVISWYRVSGIGDATNFGISADSVVATLRREKVRFGGERLVEDE
jgi:hypothetical protein